MRYACFMKCFREIGYVKLDLCEVFEEEERAQEYCAKYPEYEYVNVDPEVVCLLSFEE